MDGEADVMLIDPTIESSQTQNKHEYFVVIKNNIENSKSRRRNHWQGVAFGDFWWRNRWAAFQEEAACKECEGTPEV
jgi:hypothetical protein